MSLEYWDKKRAVEDYDSDYKLYDLNMIWMRMHITFPIRPHQ